MNVKLTSQGISKYVMKWGLIMGLVSVAYFIGVFLFDQMSNNKAGWLLYPFIGILSFVCVKQYRDKKNNGFINFNTAFRISYFSILICSAVNAIYQFFFYKIVMTPAYIERMTKGATDKLAAQGYSKEQILFALSVSRKIFENMYYVLGATLLSFAIVGALISIIVSAICKKEKDIFADSNV